MVGLVAREGCGKTGSEGGGLAWLVVRGGFVALQRHPHLLL